MAYFPTFEEKWTKTPNLFFDDILADKDVTLNQIRLVAYLIRNTLGYNKDAKWTGVTRKDLIEKAKIPNGRIKGAIDGCAKKRWILVHETGKGTKKERYIFLNDERNERILKGLERGCFTVQDLEYLNEAGIDRLLNQHNLTSTEITKENGCSYTETVEATYTETVEADTPLAQEGQWVSDPLKTKYKDNNINTVVVNNKIKDAQKLYESLFNQKLSEPSAKTLLDACNKKKISIIDALTKTKEAEKMEIQSNRPVRNLSLYL